MDIFFGLSDSRVVIRDYRMYYNTDRLHGAIGYVPPLEFKQRWLATNNGKNLGALPQTPTPSQPNNQHYFGVGQNRTSETGYKTGKELT